MEAGKYVTSETNLEVDNTSKDLYHLLRYYVFVKKEGLFSRSSTEYV